MTLLHLAKIGLNGVYKHRNRKALLWSGSLILVDIWSSCLEFCHILDVIKCDNCVDSGL